MLLSDQLHYRTNPKSTTHVLHIIFFKTKKIFKLLHTIYGHYISFVFKREVCVYHSGVNVIDQCKGHALQAKG